MPSTAKPSILNHDVPSGTPHDLTSVAPREKKSSPRLAYKVHWTGCEVGPIAKDTLFHGARAPDEASLVQLAAPLGSCVQGGTVDANLSLQRLRFLAFGGTDAVSLYWLLAAPMVHRWSRPRCTISPSPSTMRAGQHMQDVCGTCEK